ncbi:50S ribosomal protein L13 [Neofamilia massiliensis]|uniref:50S ribosomal protein L13 n=1 Tax=Neofamilia massiliensis TaxID=1673724 RepID=UPI0006BB5DDC|nr:50S ribosomal protein L13 [Neofamilia massiliensis]
MKSYMANAQNIERQWYVIDAEGMVLGRLASEIAMVLSGKRKPVYTPHFDAGDYVIVLNADKIKLTGNKWQQKTHWYHTGYPGGAKEVKYQDLVKKDPTKILRLAVKGMLPKNSMGRAMIKKMKVYTGTEHPHEAQQPIELKF